MGLKWRQVRSCRSRPLGPTEGGRYTAPHLPRRYGSEPVPGTVSLRGSVPHSLSGALLILAGAIVGSLEASSGAVPLLLFILAFVVLLIAVAPVMTHRPVDRLRATGFAGIATLVAGLGALS